MGDMSFPWVTFRLGNRLFGINCEFVEEMLLLPGLAQLPSVPDYVRGVINIRGKVIPVIDLRQRTGQKSFNGEIEELVALLGQREKDHLNWIAELENSVKEDREFKLTTDPHKCAFGKWYDTFKAGNIILENHMKRFDQPHKMIHALGTEVVELEKKGERDRALARIESERGTTLALLINLFAEAKKLLRETQREIVIVLKNGGATIGVSVDVIESVEHLKEGSIEDIPGFSNALRDGLIHKTGKTLRNERIVMLLNAEGLFSEPALATALAEAPAATPV